MRCGRGPTDEPRSARVQGHPDHRHDRRHHRGRRSAHRHHRPSPGREHPHGRVPRCGWERNPQRVRRCEKAQRRGKRARRGWEPRHELRRSHRCARPRARRRRCDQLRPAGPYRGTDDQLQRRASQSAADGQRPGSRHPRSEVPPRRANGTDGRRRPDGHPHQLRGRGAANGRPTANPRNAATAAVRRPSRLGHCQRRRDHRHGHLPAVHHRAAGRRAAARRLRRRNAPRHHGRERPRGLPSGDRSSAKPTSCRSCAARRPARGPPRSPGVMANASRGIVHCFYAVNDPPRRKDVRR